MWWNSLQTTVKRTSKEENTNVTLSEAVKTISVKAFQYLRAEISV